MYHRESNLSQDDVDMLTSFNRDKLYTERAYEILSNHLKLDGVSKPIIRKGKALSWDKITNSLDSEILIPVYLALHDKRTGQKRYTYNWPTIQGVDNDTLSDLLSSGVAETHFHLKGSSINFHLTWQYLMNNMDLSGLENTLQNIMAVSLSGIYNSEKPSDSMHKELCLAYVIRYYMYLSNEGRIGDINEVLGKLNISLFDCFKNILSNGALSLEFIEFSRMISNEKALKHFRLSKERSIDKDIMDRMCRDYVYELETHKVYLWLAPERKILYKYISENAGNMHELGISLLYINLKKIGNHSKQRSFWVS